MTRVQLAVVVGLLLVAGLAVSAPTASAHSAQARSGVGYYCRTFPESPKCNVHSGGSALSTNALSLDGGSGAATGNGGSGATTGRGGSGAASGKHGKGNTTRHGGQAGAGASGPGSVSTGPIAGVGAIQTGGGGTFYEVVGGGATLSSTRVRLAVRRNGRTEVREVRLPGTLPATGGGVGSTELPSLAGIAGLIAVLLGAWVRRRFQLTA